MALPAVVLNPPAPNALTTVEKGWLQRVIERAFPRPRTSPANLPTYPLSGVTLIGQTAGLVWKPNAGTYRAWSLTPWVHAAINIRRDQLAAAEWDIVPAEKDGKQNKRLSKTIRDFLESPNQRLDSFHSFAQMIVEDIMVLDAGCFEKVRYPNGDLAELWPTPGEYIAIDPRWDGSDPEQARYYYVPDGTVRAKFTNDNFVYMMQNPRTITPVGVSPIEILKTVIDSELQAMQYNRRQVMGAAPDGVLNIGESALKEDVAAAESKFQAEVFGQSAMAIIGGYKSPSFMKFRDTNREMQFREWQDLLLRCIAVVFGLSPMDLGITFDVNRSSAEQQADNTDDRGLRPLLDLFQRYMTREVVWDESFGGRENNLAFRFTSLNLNETKVKADINKVAMPGIGWKSVNDARIDAGRLPIGDLSAEDNIFNHILIGTPKGILDLDKQEYIGEEQLMKLQTEQQQALADQQAEHAADQSTQDSEEAIAQAKAAPKPVVKPPAAKKDDDLEGLLTKAVEPFVTRQDAVLRAIESVASRPINIEIQAPAAPNVEVHPAAIEVHPPDVHVTAPNVEVHPTQVDVHVPPMTIDRGAVQVDVHVPEPPTPKPVRKTVKRDDAGRITEVIETDG